MKFYLVGIKGSGMCALANILIDLGYEVSGCDFDKEYFTDKKLNVKIDNIEDFSIAKSYTVIVGNSFKDSKYIKEITNYYDYPEFIEKFFRMKKISISGTHGKTTTTSFISQLTNKDINVLCGDGTGIGVPCSEYLVLEACEYKDTFLNYTNEILLINNIELDHPDYFKSIDSVILSFQKAANNSKIVLINGDCLNCRRIKHYNVITFGKDEFNDIVFDYHNSLLKIYFYGCKVEININLGIHNIYNYVASYIICKLIDTDGNVINQKTKKLKLPTRRQDIYNLGNAIVVDDYAHHPTEIKATLNDLRSKYKRKIIVFFQPHTFSRTNYFRDDFIKSLSIADEVYILDIFSSVRERGYGNLLLENTCFKKFNEDLLHDIHNETNLYVFMGAGDINNLLKKVILIENK